MSLTRGTGRGVQSAAGVGNGRPIILPGSLYRRGGGAATTEPAGQPARAAAADGGAAVEAVKEKRARLGSRNPAVPAKGLASLPLVTKQAEAHRPAEEQGRARRVMAMTPEDRLKWLQDVRAIHNTRNGYWVFGVQPEAADHIVHQSCDAPPGTKALVMTDGFYRLVSPYGRYTDEGLIDAVLERGLGALMRELREMEASPEDDAKIGRFKTSDDATALLVEV